MKEVKTKAATIRVLKSGIIENIIHDYASIEEKNVLEIKTANKELSKGKPYVILVDSGIYTTISKEARELSASKDFSQQTIAKALIVRGLGQRIIGQFYINVNKPHIKTKIFAEREKAIKWLASQISKNKQ